MRILRISAVVSTLLLTVIIFSLLAGCGRDSEEEGVPLVKVGDSVITRDEVERTWMGLPDEEKVKYRDRQGLQALINNLVSVELLYQEARRQGMDKDPEIMRKLEMARQNIIVEEMITRSIKPADLYRMYQESYIRAGAIRIDVRPDNDPEADLAASRRINKIYKLLKNGGDFGALAREFSEGRMAQSGGDQGYLTQKTAFGYYGFDAQEAIFSLKDVNEFTKPVRGKGGYYIFQLLEKSGNLDPNGFTPEMGNELFEIKSEENFRGYVNELKSRVKVREYEDNMREFLSITEQVNVTAPEVVEGDSAATRNEP